MIALLTLFACGEPVPEGIAAAPAVYLNELVAWNKDGLTDEEDEVEDWIEIQVPADVTLDGWTLIPDEDGAEGLPLDGIGGGFTVIVADAEPDQGPLHAPFRFAAGGGVVLLLDDEGALVQQVHWPVAQPDISWARVAADDWTFAFEPTPGEVNEFD